MVLNEIYRKSPQFNVNYDFTDIVSKTGYFRFFLAKDSADNGILSQRELGSDNVATNYGATATTEDIDFDVEFKTQQVINGDAFLNIPCAIERGGDSGSTTMTIDVEIFHVDASGTETSLGSANGVQMSASDGGTSAAKFNFYKVSLTEKTIKPGESVRLTLSVTTTNSGANTEHAIGHDPLSRSGDYDVNSAGGTDPDGVDWSNTVISASGVTTQAIFDLPLNIEI